MIFHDVAGGGEAWRNLRLGIPTSSNFNKIMTPKKMKLSESAAPYMYILLAEWLSGKEVENFKSKYMERGNELEHKAVEAYEMLTDQETTNGGFITTDDGMIGCSPDRLVGTDGDLELKCPLIQTQVEYALNKNVDDDYRCQLQGRLMIHEREYIDIFPYHPLLSIDPIRVYRDEKFIGVLKPIVEQFVETMLQKRTELEAQYGPFARPKAPQTVDHSKDFVSDDDIVLIIKKQRIDAIGAYMERIGTVAYAGTLNKHQVRSMEDVTDANWRAIVADLELELGRQRSEKNA